MQVKSNPTAPLIPVQSWRRRFGEGLEAIARRHPETHICNMMGQSPVTIQSKMSKAACRLSLFSLQSVPQISVPAISRLERLWLIPPIPHPPLSLARRPSSELVSPQQNT